MLSVRDVQVTYGGTVQALRGVALDVGDGEVVAVLGSNGAGKTTLLRALSGTLRMHRGRVDAGSITFDGEGLAGKDPARIVGMGLVQVPEGRRIFTRLTVEENLRAGGLGSRDRAAKSKAEQRVYDLFPVLADRRSQRADRRLLARSAGERIEGVPAHRVLVAHLVDVLVRDAGRDDFQLLRRLRP